MRKQLMICDECGKTIPDTQPNPQVWDQKHNYKVVFSHHRDAAPVDLCADCLKEMIRHLVVDLPW